MVRSRKRCGGWIAVIIPLIPRGWGVAVYDSRLTYKWAIVGTPEDRLDYRKAVRTLRKLRLAIREGRDPFEETGK